MSQLPRQDTSARLDQLRAKHQDPSALVDALQRKFSSFQASEARNEAESAEEALRISREIGYERGEAIGILQIGFIHFLWQRNQEAFAHILDAQARLGLLNEPLHLARCSIVLSGLHNTVGNHQKAIEHAHEGIAQIQGSDEPEWLGWPEYMLGDAYRAIGDLSQAREHFEKALDIFANHDLQGGVARAQIGLGGVCMQLGEFEASEAFFAEAAKRAEHRDDDIAMARLKSDRALLRQRTGDYEEALQLLEESLAIRRETGSGLITATCLIDLGRLLVDIDRLDEGVERLTEALELSEAGDHGPRMYKTHKALSDAYAKKGDLAKALEHHQAFQRIKEEVMSADAATRLHNLEMSMEAVAAQKEAQLVRKHIEELTKKNDELAQALDELQDAQEMLIQSEKMASLGQLTAGIAHEIKNPLNFVNNFSVMTSDLADELTEEIKGHRSEPVESVEADFLELTAEIRANAQRILEHGRRAGQVVNSMLVHTRHSGGKKTEVDVNELAETCLDLAYHGFVGNNEGYEPEIRKQFADNAGTFVVIEEEVARVLTNILNNAFYATHVHRQSVGDGYEPRVDVQTAVVDGHAVIRIADNGPGIPDEQKSKVFEPFFTTKPTGTGTGLGLSQSYDIVIKRHGGTLRVVDTPGGGATIVMSIPVV